jgi:hypothetical protein
MLKGVKELLLDEWSVGGLSPLVGAPHAGQCLVRQRHLQQWRADGDLADRPTDIPGAPSARTHHANAREAQRQCWAPSLMRSAMRARTLSEPFRRIASLAGAGDGPICARFGCKRETGAEDLAAGGHLLLCAICS